ncbi:MAG: hypothetical protein J6I46_09475 [Ruminococcus sp.]|nr:hypothetical protein [Ruminococcus sp.]
MERRAWDYADHVKLVKQYGGPEKFMEIYGEEKFNEGELLGEEKGEKRGIAEGVIGSGIVTLVIWAIVKKHKTRNKRKKELAECKEKSEEAKQQYVKEMKKSNETVDDKIYNETDEY